MTNIKSPTDIPDAVTASEGFQIPECSNKSILLNIADRLEAIHGILYERNNAITDLREVNPDRIMKAWEPQNVESTDSKKDWVCFIYKQHNEYAEQVVIKAMTAVEAVRDAWEFAKGKYDEDLEGVEVYDQEQGGVLRIGSPWFRDECNANQRSWYKLRKAATALSKLLGRKVEEDGVAAAIEEIDSTEVVDTQGLIGRIQELEQKRASLMRENTELDLKRNKVQEEYDVYREKSRDNARSALDFQDHVMTRLNDLVGFDYKDIESIRRYHDNGGFSIDLRAAVDLYYDELKANLQSAEAIRLAISEASKACDIIKNRCNK